MEQSPSHLLCRKIHLHMLFSSASFLGSIVSRDCQKENKCQMNAIYTFKKKHILFKFLLAKSRIALAKGSPLCGFQALLPSFNTPVTFMFCTRNWCHPPVFVILSEVTQPTFSLCPQTWWLPYCLFAAAKIFPFPREITNKICWEEAHVFFV